QLPHSTNVEEGVKAFEEVPGETGFKCFVKYGKTVSSDLGVNGMWTNLQSLVAISLG
ncbi:hypothetical protein CHS0354_039687, partial [Potamilus streckersoni]